MTTVVTRSAARILLIPSILIALATMLKGYTDTGDGFSAGVIAALAVGIQGVTFGADDLERLPLIKYAPAGTFIGLLLALSLAFTPVFFGEAIMTHYPRAGSHVVHFGTLEFITPVLFDISVFLVVFGFGVGALSAIARAQQRSMRVREREAKKHVRAASTTTSAPSSPGDAAR